MPDERLAFGPFTLDPGRATLSRHGRPVSVGHKGLLLLQALLRTPGQTVDKASLMDAVWPGLAVEESNLSVQIAALRKLLGMSDDGHQWIATVPRVGYRFVGSVDSAKETAAAAPSPIQSRPSIVVLPFSLTGDGGNRQYLADGITEDIIISLARFRWFRVAARNSSFALKDRLPDIRQIARELGTRYVLEGSIRHAAPQLRISAQLIDAVDGHHVWAERYDLQMADAFAIQDEIAERVAGAIEPELLKTEFPPRGNPSHRKHDGLGSGAARYLAFSPDQREGHLTARELFRQACAADPQLPDPTSGSPGSAPASRRTVGAAIAAPSSPRRCAPPRRRSRSIRRTPTRTIHSPSSAPTRTRRSRRYDVPRKPSSSARALRSVISCLGWHACMTARRRPPWSRSSTASCSMRTTRKISSGTICWHTHTCSPARPMRRLPARATR